MMFLLIRIATGEPEKGSIEKAENDESQLGQLPFCIFLPRKFSSNAEVAQVLPEEVTEEVAEVVTKEGEGQGRRGGSAGARARPSPRKGGHQGPGVAGWFGSWRLECLDGLDGGFWLLIVAYSCL
jgi:hypothetical protein